MSERLQALRNLPSFFRLIWECSPTLTALNATLRFVVSWRNDTTMVLQLELHNILTILYKEDAASSEHLRRCWEK